MELKNFFYHLPKELVAQEPIKNREESRLMVVGRNDGAIAHRIFKDIHDYLEDGDCLVLNNTRVMPARLHGSKHESGGKIEFVLLRKIGHNMWEVLVKPGKRAKKGTVFNFGEGRLRARVVDEVEGGNRIVEFEYEGIFESILDQVGIMPLPPYIRKELKDKNRYQTVYARKDGSAAAPTAGLHFTMPLLERLKEKGIKIEYLTLHVGLGTFRPVKVNNVEDHQMHSEYYELTPQTAEAINTSRESGKKVVAVGTTSCRVLETLAHTDGSVSPANGWTDIFIYPGYRFKVVDALVTNFHLPESTLLMLVSAFAGRENMLNAYNQAIKQEYRFFSFGDAMLII